MSNQYHPKDIFHAIIIYVKYNFDGLLTYGNLTMQQQSYIIIVQWNISTLQDVLN